MPSSEDIVRGLGEIARGWPRLAVLWHLYFSVIVVALLAGYRASRRIMGVLLAIPLLSVSALSWEGGNPFNGTVFGLATVTLLVAAKRLGLEKVELASKPSVAAGTLLLAFGLVYPHFPTVGSVLSYLYAAPTGLIPCPTLSAIIGLALILGGFGSVLWPAILGVLGLFYGFYGAVTLGVSIDWILFAGAFCVLVVCVGNHRNIHGRAP